MEPGNEQIAKDTAVKILDILKPPSLTFEQNQAVYKAVKEYGDLLLKQQEGEIEAIRKLIPIENCEAIRDAAKLAGEALELALPYLPKHSGIVAQSPDKKVATDRIHEAVASIRKVSGE